MTAMLALLLDLSGTLIDLVPPRDPAALAEVVVQNFQMNGPQDEGAYPLALGDLAVTVRFHWEFGPAGEDAVVVTPPLGVTCAPIDCTAVVAEGSAGSVLLFEFLGY